MATRLHLCRFLSTLLVFSTLLAVHPAQAQLLTDPLWRVQIRLYTGNVRDGSTDDDVSVMLSPNNRTWLDYGGNDFVQGRNRTYDLLLTNLQRVGDISQIRFDKVGKDGWCLEKYELLVNEQLYSGQTFNCLWIDSDDGHSPTLTIPRARAHFPGGQMSILPDVLLKTPDVVSLIESAVGHEIANANRRDPLYWGHISGPAVEYKRVDDRTLHIDLDLAMDVSGGTDPEIDVDYDIRFECGTEITVSIQNPKTDVGSGIGGGGIITSNRLPLMDFSAARLLNVVKRMARDRFQCVRILNDGILLVN